MHHNFPDLPEALRIPQDQRRAAWKGRRLKPIKPFAQEAKAIDDPGTIRLLAEIAAKEKARAAEKAEAREESRIIGNKKRTRTLAMKAALAETNQQLSTDGETTMATKTKKRPAKKTSAKRGKQVVSRLKTKTPKRAEPLKKPRPERKPRIAPPPKPPRAPKVATPKAPKADSKGAQLEAMLRKGNVSVAEIAEQLGWLAHTTRAAISRVGFEVTTEKKEGVTLYHIAADAKAKEKAKADAPAA